MLCLLSQITGIIALKKTGSYKNVQEDNEIVMKFILVSEMNRFIL